MVGTKEQQILRWTWVLECLQTAKLCLPCLCSHLPVIPCSSHPQKMFHLLIKVSVNLWCSPWSPLYLECTNPQLGSSRSYPLCKVISNSMFLRKWQLIPQLELITLYIMPPDTLNLIYIIVIVCNILPSPSLFPVSMPFLSWHCFPYSRGRAFFLTPLFWVCQFWT